MKNQKWEKEFEKRFYTQLIDDYGDEHLFDAIEDFIRSLLSQTRKETIVETIEEIKAKLPLTINPTKLEGSYGAGTDYELGRNDYKVQVSELLEKLKEMEK